MRTINIPAISPNIIFLVTLLHKYSQELHLSRETTIKVFVRISKPPQNPATTQPNTRASSTAKMSNSTNPTGTPLSYLVTRECDINSVEVIWSRHAQEPPTVWLPMNNDTWGGLSQICPPGSINLYGCTLWCELPWDFQQEFKATGSKDLSGYVRERLLDTGMNRSAYVASTVGSDGIASLRPPSLTTLATSMLLASTLIGLLGC